MRRIANAVLTLALLVSTGAVARQDGPTVSRIEVRPTTLSLVTGQTATLTIRAFDQAGQPIASPSLRVAAPRREMTVANGEDQGAALIRNLVANAAGNFEVVVSSGGPGAGGEGVSVTIPVSVSWPAVARVDIAAQPGTLYAGTALGHSAKALHADGTVRADAAIRWTTSDASVATVDRFGQVTAHRAGAVMISADVAGRTGSVRYNVAPFPAERLVLSGNQTDGRTGDVFSFDVQAIDAGGRSINDVPVTWAFTFQPDDSIAAPGASGQIDEGHFVAEVPGRYTILAMAGPLTAREAIDVRPRSVVREVTLEGHGAVRDVHTSDLWVFEGVDGRDYAVTGTWGGEGKAYFWDVTNPASISKIDSIQIDARTVNDVKVSPNGRYAALSREGASNRRNGVVILDLANPRQPRVASVYDDGLTGGVHNMFATDDYLFALSGGDKYVILDVRDLANPKYVSEYNHPDSRIHDVWVLDGMAYSSEWGNGVVVVDVGNGKYGGSIENPVFVTNVPYPVGRTHAAFPYYSESANKFYLFLGDEIMNRRGMAFDGPTGRTPYDPATGEGGLPPTASGYVHIIDFTDPMNPKDVARYHVEEFGTHNIWVEDDVLYQAYYDGGMRVVDVSGDLMGNLANQQREIAVYKATDPVGYMSNAPMTWGGQPHKGHVFFTDWNSGLWAVKIAPKERATS